MAEFSKQTVLTFLTDEDLSSSAYRCVAMGTDELVGITTSTTVPPMGILTDNVANGSSSNAAVSVAVSGVAKVEAGAVIASGVGVMPGTGGKVITATTGNVAIGIATVASLADGNIITVIIDRYEFT
jgi:hypothetical protein